MIAFISHLVLWFLLFHGPLDEASKSVCELHSKSCSVPRNDILHVERSGRIAVFLTKQVIHAHRGLQSLNQVPAEKREIDDGVASRFLPRFDDEIRECAQRRACRDVLKIESGKKLLFDDRHTEVELEQVLG